MSIWPQVRSGDLDAVQTYLKLVDTRERLRQRYYLRRPDVLVTNQTTNLSAPGVIVIRGRTSEEYIAGLRAARGEAEQPALPPPQRQLLGVPVDPDLEPGIPASPGGRAERDLFRDGSVEQVGLSDREVSQPSQPSDIIDQ
jgi:hypothetical protein